jgi:hypothetical protein
MGGNRENETEAGERDKERVREKGRYRRKL